MANIISGPISWNQEDAAKYFLQPLFISNNALNHFDVMTNISGGKILLDSYAAMKDVTKALNSTECFAENTEQAANTQVELVLDRLEVEHKQKAASLFNHIKSQFLKKGVARMDLSGTMLMEIISELLMGGIMRDFSTILWWGDKTNGAAGTPQKLSDGIWEAISGMPGAGAGTGQNVTYTGAAAASNILDNLADLMTARTPELAQEEQVMFVSRSFADRYREALIATTSGAAYMDLQKGFSGLQYNGIDMVVMPDWDVNIAEHGADIANTTGAPSGTGKTECAMLLAKNAIAIGTDWEAQDVDMWYNKDCKENRFRMVYSFGCALKSTKLVATITY
jgi:hypothetical protein|tara:strand:+ start:23582 stop:24592 length:1011 start_codon:yes stop_codon:yes gene_type:complete